MGVTDTPCHGKAIVDRLTRKFDIQYVILLIEPGGRERVVSSVRVESVFQNVKEISVVCLWQLQTGK